MTKPGPKPKPTTLRLLEGNRGRLRIPAEMQIEHGDVEPPETLSAGAREVWDRLAPELVRKLLLAPRFVDEFVVYCEAIPAFVRAAAIIAAAGPVVQGRNGGLVSNPASKEFARYANIIRIFGSEFGLSPAAVTAIARDNAEAEAALSPARLLG